MTKTIRRSQQPKSVKSIPMILRQFLKIKETITELSSREKELKQRLVAAVERDGFEDDKGHKWLEFDEPIEGCTALKWQRAVSQSLDERKATEILMERGLYDACTETVVVLDEEAILRLFYEGEITQDEFDTMFPKRETWSLRPQRGDQ